MTNSYEFKLSQTAFRAGQWMRRGGAVACLVDKTLRFLQGSINFSIFTTNKINYNNSYTVYNYLMSRIVFLKNIL